MGSYCRYCQHRCFVVRILREGRSICLATCPAGMAWDRKVTGGQDHTTTLNPITMRRDVTPDARRAADPGSGFTLNARITVRIITDLMAAEALTAQGVACLAGVPETYNVINRRRTYV
jgi:hypothetical protein